MLLLYCRPNPIETQMLDVFKNNEKRQIEEGHAKRKRTKEHTTIYKTLHRKQTKDRTTRNQIKTGFEFRCSGRESSSWSTCDRERYMQDLYFFQLLIDDNLVSCHTVYSNYLTAIRLYNMQVGTNVLILSKWRYQGVERFSIKS